MSSIGRDALATFLDKELDIRALSDSSVNGVQIEGKDTVRLLAVAVDAGLSVIEEAVQKKADFLIVHHGVFWGGSSPLVGPMKKLFSLALENGLTLYAAHLPLDAHQAWGNNFSLARLLKLENLQASVPYNGGMIGCTAENPLGTSLKELASILEQLPGARCPLLTLPFGPATPKKICIVSGSGSDSLWRAKMDGFDTLITGEPRQSCFHYAQEQGLNVIFGGHYATETIGVREVAKAIQTQFGVPWVFLDQPTGI